MIETRNEPKKADAIHDCHVIEIGIGNLAECANWGPVVCEHAMPFGNTFLCLHPRLNDMIEHTKKDLAAHKIQE